MNILGIGPLELAFIVIIALIIFGPQDLVKAGKNIGRFMRKVITSSGWKVVQDTSKEIRDLPTRLIREAGLEDIEEEMRSLDPSKMVSDLNESIRGDLSSWTTPPTPKKDSGSETEQAQEKIHPVESSPVEEKSSQEDTES